MKSQRCFWMQVQGVNQTWTFQSPLSLELNITRAAFNSLSEGLFRIYNLGESTRSDIYQDWYDQGQYRQVTVRAGYRSWASAYGPPNLAVMNNLQPNIQSLPVIFKGNISKAYSQREGSSWVTTIDAWDGGYGVTQSDTNVALHFGTKLQQQFAALIDAMGSTISVGYIDPSLGIASLRGVALSGSPWVKIQQLADAVYATAFIDLEKVYVIGKGNRIPNVPGGLTLISPATGLLDTPMKQNTQISFDMIFEPRLKVGQQITLQSIETVNNGSYPVIGIDHVGMISDSAGGDLRTRVYCYYSQSLVPFGAIE